MPAPVSQDLIPPAVRSRLKDLRLVARRAIGLQGIGLHPSRSRGAGLEFAQYRAYEPGDELRQVDWKLYARSDRFFVREAERESPLAVWIVLDASASMMQADIARPGWTRFDAAKALAMCIAEMALRQGDRFGLVVLRDGAGDGLAPDGSALHDGARHDAGLRLLPADSGVRQRDRMLLALHGLRASGGFPDATQLLPVWERIGAHDLVLVLSDCFDDGVVALMQRLAAARREVLAIELLGADERDFPFRGGHRFRDQETAAEVLGDGVALRDDFLRRFADARAALHAGLDASGIRHALHVLNEPLDAPLRALFGVRDRAAAP